MTKRAGVENSQASDKPTTKAGVKLKVTGAGVVSVRAFDILRSAEGQKQLKSEKLMSVNIRMNQYNVLEHPCQGDSWKFLTVCSAGCLRSPTIANELIKRGHNARCCGAVGEYAIIPITHSLLVWAQTVIVVSEQVGVVEFMCEELVEANHKAPEVIEFDIPDVYHYNDPELVRIINEKLDGLGI